MLSLAKKKKKRRFAETECTKYNVFFDVNLFSHASWFEARMIVVSFYFVTKPVSEIIAL